MKDYGLVDAWLNAGKSESTKKQYQSHIKEFIEYCTKPDVKGVGMADLESFIEWRCAGKLGRSSRNIVVSCLRSFFSFCYDVGALDFNPAASLSRAPLDDLSKQHVLSIDDVMSALNLEVDSRHKDLLAISFGTGATLNEVLKLKGADIEGFTPFRLSVDEFRVIACCNSMSMFLSKDFLASERNDYLLGGEVPYITAYRWIKSAFERVGIEGVTGTRIRFSSAVYMRSKGASWDYIANQLNCSPIYAMKTFGPLTKDFSMTLDFALSL